MVADNPNLKLPTRPPDRGALAEVRLLEARRKSLNAILIEERKMRDAINVMRQQLTKITKTRSTLQRQITNESL